MTRNDTPHNSGSANLGARIAVAVVGIPLILVISIWGGIAFLLFVTIASSLALWEFYKLAETKGAKPMAELGLAAGVAVTLCFYYAELQVHVYNVFVAIGISPAFPTQLQLLFIVIVLSVVTFSLVELFRNSGSPLANIGATLLGVLYVSLFFGTLVGVRELFQPLTMPMVRYFPDEAGFTDPDAILTVYRWGGYTVVSLFACIWICDTAAYFVGLGIGKRKLFPRVSPNKTWEGAVAGFLAAVGAAIGAKVLLLDYMTVGQALVFGIFVGVFGQIGDLVESLFKRDAGVKDSSSFIPGHGGVFDRFDSLIFASPLLYLYLDFVVFS